MSLTIKILSALLILIMLFFTAAACKPTGPNNKTTSSSESTSSSTSTSETTSKTEPQKPSDSTSSSESSSSTPSEDDPVVDPEPDVPPAEIIHFSIDFNNVSKVSDILLPNGITLGTLGNVSINKGLLKIGCLEEDFNKNGEFTIEDTMLSVDDKYSALTVKTDWILEKLPETEDGLVSVIAPIYTKKDQSSVDQFFVKVNSNGELFYYDNENELGYSPVLDEAGDPVTISVGPSKHILKCDFAFDESITFSVYLDGKEIVRGKFDYAYTADDTEGFYIKFGEAKGDYQMMFDEIEFTAVPVINN